MSASERGSVDQNHKINKKGKRYFESCLDPDDWIDRTEGSGESDYHIDYCLELVESDNPTGKQVRVQLKSRKSLKVIGGTIKQVVKVRHLKYWANDCDLPVFLVVVDISKKCGYAVFIQEWFDKQSLNKGWENQERIQISFNDDFPIDDSRKIKELAYHAKKYMRNKFPGSVEAAIRAKRDSIEKLDPRFYAEVSYVNHRTAISLRAREDVSLKLTVNGSEEVAKLNGSIGFGRECSIPAGSFEIEGSALFRKLIQEKGGSLILGPSKSSQADFRFFNDSTNDLLFVLPAIATRGTHGGAVRSDSPEHPFDVDVLVNRAGALDSKTVIQLKNWGDAPIRELKYLGDMMALARVVDRGQPVRLEVIVEGELCCSLLATAESLAKSIQELSMWVRLLFSVRRLARLFQMDLTLNALSRIVNSDNYFDILEICEMFDERVYNAGDVVATFTVSKLTSKMRSILSKEDSDGLFSVEYGFVEVEVLGVTARVSNLRYEFSKCEVCFDEDEKSDFERGSRGSFEVSLKYRKGSNVVKSHGVVEVLDRKDLDFEGS